MEFETITEKVKAEKKSNKQAHWTPEFKEELLTSLMERKDGPVEKQDFAIPVTMFKTEVDGKIIGYIGPAKNLKRASQTLVYSLLGIEYNNPEGNHKHNRAVVNLSGDAVEVYFSKML